MTGKQIPAHQPYVLHHGDIVILGKLRLQVLIGDEKDVSGLDDLLWAT